MHEIKWRSLLLLAWVDFGSRRGAKLIDDPELQCLIDRCVVRWRYHRCRSLREEEDDADGECVDVSLYFCGGQEARFEAVS